MQKLNDEVNIVFVQECEARATINDPPAYYLMLQWKKTLVCCHSSENKEIGHDLKKVQKVLIDNKIFPVNARYIKNVTDSSQDEKRPIVKLPESTTVYIWDGETETLTNTISEAKNETQL